MSLILHIIIIASYFVLSSAVALVAPGIVPALSTDVAPLAAGMVFLGCAIAHVMFAQSERNRRLLRELTVVRRQTREIAEDLLSTQTQALQMRQTVDQAGRAGEQRVSEVIAEVKVLQGLIEVFSRKQEASALAAGELQLAERPKLVAVEGGKAVSAPSGADFSDVDDPEVIDIVREALRLDRVDVYLQPIVSLPQRKNRYYECYTRIRSEDGTVIGPGQYIGVAEREGMVSAIDNMLLFRCVQLIRRTQKRNYDTAFFCNISRESLGDTAFIGDFVDFVSENPDLAPKLFFEFGQGDIETAPPATIGNLARLADLGFRFSLDQVTHLNLDIQGLSAKNFRFVKVDASFLLDRNDELVGDIARQDIKKMLDRDGLDLIVEKIEDERQVVELLDFEIDFGQGYLFGEPRLSRTD
ncbi:MAG: EAL domain-containing protein [Alphaproteobacteria bacterium]